MSSLPILLHYPQSFDFSLLLGPLPSSFQMLFTVPTYQSSSFEKCAQCPLPSNNVSHRTTNTSDPPWNKSNTLSLPLSFPQPLPIPLPSLATLCSHPASSVFADWQGPHYRTQSTCTAVPEYNGKPMRPRTSLPGPWEAREPWRHSCASTYLRRDNCRRGDLPAGVVLGSER